MRKFCVGPRKPDFEWIAITTVLFLKCVVPDEVTFLAALHASLNQSESTHTQILQNCFSVVLQHITLGTRRSNTVSTFPVWSMFHVHRWLPVIWSFRSWRLRCEARSFRPQFILEPQISSDKTLFLRRFHISACTLFLTYSTLYIVAPISVVSFAGKLFLNRWTGGA